MHLGVLFFREPNLGGGEVGLSVPLIGQSFVTCDDDSWKFNVINRISKFHFYGNLRDIVASRNDLFFLSFFFFSSEDKEYFHLLVS